MAYIILNARFRKDVKNEFEKDFFLFDEQQRFWKYDRKYKVSNKR